MLFLSKLNETIEKKEKEKREEEFKRFEEVREQVEKGIQKIAERGERNGVFNVRVKGQMNSIVITEILREHYSPIEFYLVENNTYSGNQRSKIPSQFTIEVIIPPVGDNDIYGCNISK